MSAIKIIQALGRKIAARKSKTPEGITQIQPQIYAESEAGSIAQTLVDAGLPMDRFDDFIRSEGDLVRILNQIKAIEKRNLAENIRSGIGNTKSAKIFNTAGEELDPNQPIIGGTQPGKKIDTDAFIRNAEAQELETKIQKKLEKGNKEAAQRIRMKKMVDDAIDNVSPGFSGDTKYDATLVAEDLAERMGKVYDDLPQMERLDLYDKAYTGLSAQRYKGFKKPKDADDPNYDAEPADFDPDADNETFAQGGRAGFFMGGPNPRGLGLLRQLLKFFGKKSEVIKNPSDVLRVSNPKAFNKMLEDAKGKMMRQEGILATDAVKNYQTQMAKDRVDTVREMLERGKRFKVADDKIVAYKNEVKERLMRELNMSEEAAEKAANNMATLAMDVTKMEKTPKITDEGLLQLENVLKNMETGGKKARDLNADGGRIGFKDGMSRRTFLKLFGGLVSLPIIGKIVKPIKLATGVKKVPIIKTDDVAGKPEWFDALVNKVIIEGDDVTKKFATKDREIVHMKVLDEGTGGKEFPPGTPAADDTSIIVTQDLDNGAIRVEYRSTENMYGDPVQLQYKKPLPDEGDPRPAAEFDTAESGPVGRSVGPDDYDIDIDEVSGTSISDLTSDVSKLKEYATGKKPTLKEFIQSKKRKDKAKAISEGGEAEAEEVTRRQGDYIQFEDLPDEADFASGGIARMLGE